MTQTAPNLPFDPETDNLERAFRTSLHQFCDFLRRSGHDIEPDQPGTWKQFRSLSSEGQKEAFRKFLVFQQVTVNAHKEGINIDDDRSMTWWSLKEFGLRPCSDLFSHLVDGDVLEVYDINHVQMYRNWAFFEHSGYTMGDIFVFSWLDLYNRAADVTVALLTQVGGIFAGKVHTTIPCATGAHEISETMSKSRKHMELEVKFLSPLYDKDGATTAYIAISNVRQLGLGAPLEPATPAPTIRLHSV